MQQLPEVAKAFEQYERKIQRELKRDRPKLFRALAELVGISGDKGSWERFRRHWPNFFPEEEYKRVANDESPSIADYPYWLDHIWKGGEPLPYLEIMLGIRGTPQPDQIGPEEAGARHLVSLPVLLFQLDWSSGSMIYHGGCGFHRALYLLYRESWRAKVCEVCETAFVAKRAAQKYCSTDCSETMQREVKKQWWRDNGQEWRKGRETSTSETKGGKNGTQKTR